MSYRRLISCAFLLALALLHTSACSLLRPSQATLGTPLPIPEIPDAVSAQIDAGQRFQTIDGFGVNLNGTYWGNGKLAPALDALHGDLGATLFRVIIETPYWETTNDNDDPRTFDWRAYDAIYAGPEFQSLFGILHHLQMQPDVRVVLSVMGPVPPWMGSDSIDAAAEDEWVEMITSLLVYAREREDLAIELLSPLNEIDLGTPEGPSLNARRATGLFRKLALRLDELAFNDVRLVVPELAFNKEIPEYLPTLFADDLVMAKVDDFSFHDYSGEIVDVRQMIANSPYPDRGFWMTEYSQWCLACDKSAEHADKWVFGADTVSFLLHYLERGASAAMIYDGLDGFYTHHGTFDYWGAAAYDPDTGDFAPRPRFHASAQVFRFVRPGMVRIAASESSGGLALLAFLDPTSGGLSIVGRNPTSHPVTLTGSLAGFSAEPALRLYQTTSGGNLSPGPLDQSAGAFSAQLAPDSIFALSSLQP